MSLESLSLTDLKNRYPLILNAMSEGVYGLDSEGKATFVNPAAERLTGWTAEEILGKNIHQFHHHSHADGRPYPDTDCPIYQTRISGQPAHHEHEVFWRKDGSCFAVEYSSTPIEDKGQIVGVVVVFKDISERVQRNQELESALQKVEALQEALVAENRYLKDEIQDQQQVLLGQSDIMQALRERIQQVGPTSACVLIEGESGTGKELVAHGIHQHSQRADKALIKINCGAIAENLIESELFGHEKGAFTGATQRRLGRFESADGGTLFLDEVGELTPAAQVKLLRILQEQEFERIGSNQTIKVDVRIIAATNRNLQQLVEEGRFRADLYYRLAVFPLWVPALRQRQSDIPLLANHFLQRIERQVGKPCAGISPDSLHTMMQYRWPGNVRELYNLVERSLILHQGQGLLEVHLDQASTNSDQTNSKPVATLETSTSALTSLADFEKSYIERVLAHCQGIISGKKGAAHILDLPASTLRSRMKKLGISNQHQKR